MSHGKISRLSRPSVNHMVFHDIAQDSLVWDWEASRDAGRT